VTINVDLSNKCNGRRRSFYADREWDGLCSDIGVNFNGAAKATTINNATQLTAGITAADILTARVSTWTVTNPAPGGSTSNAASSLSTVHLLRSHLSHPRARLLGRVPLL